LADEARVVQDQLGLAVLHADEIGHAYERASRLERASQRDSPSWRSNDLLAHALDDHDVHEMHEVACVEAHRLDGDALVFVVDGDLVDRFQAWDVLDEVREIRLVDRTAERPPVAVFAADERMQELSHALLDLALQPIRLTDRAPQDRDAQRDLR